ncbi:uncharacterized protein LOC127863407 [Dreissena polymorpha]|uniref:Uncharacterized protein n=1 Tax=Dreissena polymorpha TaxID=45954 RepID=A0A9D3Y614_DREPO|nr:uncharacterized protein LOC127863407 [Dreissena polymorpha]KAH3692413.1 hypothetical protein DPMN_194863 [Dreissena polymorpha]
MEAGTQIVDQFQNAIQRANSDVSDLDTSLKNFGPIAREETILQRQKRETEVFISKVNDLDNMLDDLESRYDSMKADSYVTPSGGLKAQLDQLRNQQEKLRDKSEERLQEVQTIYGTLEGVTDNLRRMRTCINRASDELEMQEPIGTDVNAIKRLQDELKMLPGDAAADDNSHMLLQFVPGDAADDDDIHPAAAVGAWRWCC